MLLFFLHVGPLFLLFFFQVLQWELIVKKIYKKKQQKLPHKSTKRIWRFFQSQSFSSSKIPYLILQNISKYICYFQNWYAILRRKKNRPFDLLSCRGQFWPARYLSGKIYQICSYCTGRISLNLQMQYQRQALDDVKNPTVFFLPCVLKIFDQWLVTGPVSHGRKKGCAEISIWHFYEKWQKVWSFLALDERVSWTPVIETLWNR